MNKKIFYILSCFILLKTNNLCVLSADTRPFLNTYVSKGAAPFIVNVKSIINGKEKTCTGTILDKNWVLTLASCVPPDEDEANITVIANLNSYEGSSVNDTDLQERYITHVVVNPHYKANKLGDADLALLQVQKPFEENEFVNSINIDVDGWPLDDGKPIKRTCGVIGFGDIDHTKRDTKLKMRRVQVTHSDDCPCARRNQWMNLVCLESVEDVGLCPQDDGAPLVCKEKIVGVNHMLVVKSNCSKTRVPQDICGDYRVVSYFMYLCPYLSWVKESVVSVPAFTKHCNISPSIHQYPYNNKLLLLLFVFKYYVLNTFPL